MRKILPILMLALATLAWADDTTPPPTDPEPNQIATDVSTAADTGLVTISSRGADVRNVLFDLFRQSGKNFVLEPNIRHILYLSLAGVDFSEALEIVCQTASLQYEVQNGIYYIGKRRVGTVVTPAPAPAQPTVRIVPQGKLTDEDLQKRLTTRLSVTDIRKVFEEFSKQTGIKIEVTANVPNYKLDAFLIDTSLKFAMDVVTRAAGLVYTRTDNKTLRVDIAPKN